MLPRVGPLVGPKNGLLSNTQKWIVWGDTHADKAKDFIEKGCPGRGHQGKGLMIVYGQSSCLLPIFGPAQGPSRCCQYLSAKLHSIAKFSGRLAEHIMGWRLLPPFGPSWILPVFGGSTVFLWGSPVVWQLTKRLLSCLAKVGGFCEWFPNTQSCHTGHVCCTTFEYQQSRTSERGKGKCGFDLISTKICFDAI